MIIVENLYFSYKDDEILQNLNFRVNSGKWISIIGGNGSGKSTLARILVGLLPIQKGRVIIDNIALTEENLFLLRSRIGIIFQNPDYQFIGCDVKHDIAFGLENQNLSREEMQKKIFNIAKKLNILHLLDCNPQELSGGQKQLVAIASVLVMDPQIIIFDEPTSFLDPQGTKEVNNIIKDIHRTDNKILIIITHDWEFAFQSDEIIFLQKGNLLKQDTPVNFMKDEIFLKNNFINLPLSLKLYYQLQQDFNQLQNPPIILSKLKDFFMAIQFKDVSFTYNKDDIFSLNKINLSINTNQEFIAIVGPTGSGKSTLVQIMNGLLLSTKGIVKIFDKIINDKTSSTILTNLRRKIGLIFQFPEYQLFESTVLKDVLFALTSENIKISELQIKAIKILNKVGINSNFLNTSPFKLSGGQQRKVAIAGILIMEPQIIIADEPTRGLDAQGYFDIINIFQYLYQVEKKTIVCITHDMNLVAQYATRVIFMEKGNIVFDNSKEIFFKNFELQKFNLYEPQTFRILKLIEKSLNIPFRPVYSEEECLSYLRKVYLGGI